MRFVETCSLTTGSCGLAEALGKLTSSLPAASSASKHNSKDRFLMSCVSQVPPATSFGNGFGGPVTPVAWKSCTCSEHYPQELIAFVADVRISMNEDLGAAMATCFRVCRLQARASRAGSKTNLADDEPDTESGSEHHQDGTKIGFAHRP